MLGIWGQMIVSHNSSQGAKTLAGSLFTRWIKTLLAENVDAENIITLKFNGKVICCDGDWDVIVKGLRPNVADKNAATRIRVFPVEVGKRQ